MILMQKEVKVQTPKIKYFMHFVKIVEKNLQNLKNFILSSCTKNCKTSYQTRPTGQLDANQYLMQTPRGVLNKILDLKKIQNI